MTMRAHAILIPIVMVGVDAMPAFAVDLPPWEYVSSARSVMAGPPSSSISSSTSGLFLAGAGSQRPGASASQNSLIDLAVIRCAGSINVQGQGDGSTYIASSSFLYAFNVLEATPYRISGFSSVPVNLSGPGGQSFGGMFDFHGTLQPGMHSLTVSAGASHSQIGFGSVENWNFTLVPAPSAVALGVCPAVIALRRRSRA